MKKSIIKFLHKQLSFCLMIIFFVVLFSRCNKNSDEGVLDFNNYSITENLHDASSDWEQIVLDEFGSEYRVADWNDLNEFYTKGGDLLALFNYLGLIDYNIDVTVTRNGDKTYTDTRFYFASRHEHNKPNGYLAHDNIDNYLISLGSWSGNRKILAIKK